MKAVEKNNTNILQDINIPATETLKEDWGKGTLDLLSWFKIDKTRNAKVMVVGAGALGNEVLKNLALFGVGNIVIVDFDTIEYSNLTRSFLFRPKDADKNCYKAEIAAERMKEINPAIKVHPICDDLSSVGLGVYRRMDVVLGCLDSDWARVLLNQQCFRVNKIFINGGIFELRCQVDGFKLDVSCYECTSDGSSGNLSCGDLVFLNEEQGRLATTSISASITGAIQVQEALKIIHQDELKKIKEEKNVNFNSIIGNSFVYNGTIHESDFFENIGYCDSCKSHKEWKDIKISTLSADKTIKEAFQILKSELNVDKVVSIRLNNRFVDFLVSRDGENFEVMLPESKIKNYVKKNEMLKNLAEYKLLEQHTFDKIEEDTFPYLHYTLLNVGIPYLDVIKVEFENKNGNETGFVYVELHGDIERYKEIFND